MYACAAGDGEIRSKIEKWSHIIGTAPILEMACAYGLRPRLWLLMNMKIEKLPCQSIIFNLKIQFEGMDASFTLSLPRLYVYISCWFSFYPLWFSFFPCQYK